MAPSHLLKKKLDDMVQRDHKMDKVQRAVNHLLAEFPNSYQGLCAFILSADPKPGADTEAAAAPNEKPAGSMSSKEANKKYKRGRKTNDAVNTKNKRMMTSSAIEKHYKKLKTEPESVYSFTTNSTKGSTAPDVSSARDPVPHLGLDRGSQAAVPAVTSAHPARGTSVARKKGPTTLYNSRSQIFGEARVYTTPSGCQVVFTEHQTDPLLRIPYPSGGDASDPVQLSP